MKKIAEKKAVHKIDNLPDRRKQLDRRCGITDRRILPDRRNSIADFKIDNSIGRRKQPDRRRGLKDRRILPDRRYSINDLIAGFRMRYIEST